jgi:hypothetical protein
MPIGKVKLTNNELGLKEKVNEMIEKINELEQKIDGSKEVLKAVKEVMLELMDTDVAIRHKFGCREDHSLDRIGGWKDV